MYIKGCGLLGGKNYHGTNRKFRWDTISRRTEKDFE